jgi:hypothetical protein
MLLFLPKAEAYACARAPLPPTEDELKGAIHIVGDLKSGNCLKVKSTADDPVTQAKIRAVA